MNDYSFGNYLYEKRKLCGYSQTQLAQFLGVTNKAVSKWENGRAKPTVDTLRKLAAVLGTDIEDLLRKRDEKSSLPAVRAPEKRPP